MRKDGRAEMGRKVRIFGAVAVGMLVDGAVVVVENDERLADAITLMGKLRSAGFAAELVASGSPRKRFDKAKKLLSHSLVSFAVTDDGSPMRIMGDGGERHTAVESFIVAGQ